MKQTAKDPLNSKQKWTKGSSYKLEITVRRAKQDFIMDEIIFDQYRDPFRAFNIHMSIICDLEQGGKITEEEAFKQIKDLYKQFKYYYKHTVKPRVESMDKKGYYK